MGEAGVLAKLSGSLRAKWLERTRHPKEQKPKGAAPTSMELLIRRAVTVARAGDFETAIQLFDEALVEAPDLIEVIEARAELLDMAGRTDEAAAGYSRARRLQAEVRQGPPDRPFAVRLRGNFITQIYSYDIVIRSLSKNALPYLARGNAYLASNQPDKALDDYEAALKVKPGIVDAIMLKAEALLQLGRHEEALATIDTAPAPRSADVLSTRAAILMALGRLAAACSDLSSQLALLPVPQSAARGCLAMRLASYDLAAAEFDRALLRCPTDPYWRLYRGTAQAREGRPGHHEVASVDGLNWPELLLAFQAGHVAEEKVTAQANSRERRAEASFQFGVRSASRDPEAARLHWRKVIELGPPSMIEYAAARNELARA